MIKLNKFEFSIELGTLTLKALNLLNLACSDNEFYCFSATII